MIVTNQKMEIMKSSCDIDAENDIGLLGPVSQSNDATGSGTASIFQNNEIDGDDAADIPGINQVIVADNSVMKKVLGLIWQSVTLDNFKFY